MIYQPLYEYLDAAGLQVLRQTLEQQINQKLAEETHGKMPLWQDALAALPAITPSQVELQSEVRIGQQKDLNGVDIDALKTCLKAFHPWRKGPYRFFDIEINTEWRSD